MIELISDYHIHTSFCNHASGTMKEYVKAAISSGLKEMGFADHNPFPAQYDSHYRMRYEDLNNYYNIIEDLRTQFPQIEIKIGIELDYVAMAIDYLIKFLNNNKFDYVIGSVHYLNINSSHQLVYLNDFQLDNKTELYQQYFKAVEESIRTGLFDIVGHFDLPKRFWGSLNSESISYAEKILRLIKEYDLCLEVNTSGFRINNTKATFPGEYLLIQAQKMNIPICLGSDAHSPVDVASHFKKTISILQHIGFREICTFSKRKRKSIPII